MQQIGKYCFDLPQLMLSTCYLVSGESCLLEPDSSVLHSACKDRKTDGLEILISLSTELSFVIFLILELDISRLSGCPFPLFVCLIQVEILASFSVHF